MPEKDWEKGILDLLPKAEEVIMGEDLSKLSMEEMEKISMSLYIDQIVTLVSNYKKNPARDNLVLGLHMVIQNVTELERK